MRRRKASRPTAAIAAREPRVVSEHAGEQLGGEVNFDPCRSLATYDGADLVGFVVERGGRFVAFDLRDRLLGSFPTLRAADALDPTGAPLSRSRNGLSAPDTKAGRAHQRRAAE